jgi:hypothetical protein
MHMRIAALGSAACGRFDCICPVRRDVSGCPSGWRISQRRWTLNRPRPSGTSRTSCAAVACALKSSRAPAGSAPAQRLKKASAFPTGATDQIVGLPPKSPRQCSGCLSHRRSSRASETEVSQTSLFGGDEYQRASLKRGTGRDVS